MTKRLQIIVGEEELREIRAAAQRRGLTMSEWVRQVLRQARREHGGGDTARKLAVVRAAATHRFPSGDVEQMLHEISPGSWVSTADPIHVRESGRSAVPPDEME